MYAHASGQMATGYRFWAGSVATRFWDGVGAVAWAARRSWVVTGGVVLTVALVLLGVWLLRPGAKPAPRARQYLAFTVCLLTDGRGNAGEVASPVWAGMQDASLATHAKVSFLAVPGPDTLANAQPYLVGLVQKKCELIVAVGSAEVGAVRSVAVGYPQVRFAVVDQGAASPNVIVMNAATSDEVRTAVDSLVSSVVRSASHQ